MNDRVLLDVGGGLEPRSGGYINVDLYAEGPGIIKAPAWDLPYPTASVDAINCTHVLEHVEKRKVAPTLREFYRVLKPGGLLVLEVPDILWICDNMLQHPDDPFSIDLIMGNQDPPGGQFHQSAYTPESLHKHLLDAGFQSGYYMAYPYTHQQRCIHVEVFR